MRFSIITAKAMQIVITVCVEASEGLNIEKVQITHRYACDTCGSVQISTRSSQGGAWQ